MRRILERGIVLVLVVLFSGCGGGSEPEPGRVFAGHKKQGRLALYIIGDYFHNNFVAELTRISRALSPQARQIIICARNYENALKPYLEANGVRNVEYVVVDDSSFVLTQWARDVAVASTNSGASTIVVSPNKHAGSREAAGELAVILAGILPDRDVRLAPFVFEAGNLAFVESQGRRILIAGRKLLFDNAAYQTRPWAAGYDAGGVLREAARVFDVDTVLVVGRAAVRPPTRLYFEYHIDMGMVILRGNRAVVSSFDYGDAQEVSLSLSLASGHPVVAPFVAGEWDRSELPGLLSRRLRSVAAEYEQYARLLDSLGVDVYRSPVGWEQVTGSMSWTNVVQTGDRILIPLYPDSLFAAAGSTAAVGGQTTLIRDVSRVGRERFTLTGRNGRNYDLYRSLGYDVVPVPECLHYMMGGIHCFVNILE